METKWKVTGPAERRRDRRRIWLLTIVFVLLLLPALWLLSRDARSTDVLWPTSGPSAGSRTLQRIPEPSQHARIRNARATPGESTENEGRCDDVLILVDREHALSADYAPGDLVSLRDIGVPILGQEALLRRKAAESLERLVVAAASEGQELAIASAYRSYADQSTSYARLVSIYGKNADKMSAPPGHSQHQLGTAVDFTNADVGYEVSRHFGRTTASRWLLDHAADHGFVLAYPRGGKAATGYGWEPWHYRYVGVENAREVEEGDLGLQGFLSREGVLPGC